MHLIEIYISPNGDHLWEVVTAPASGRDGSSESPLGVARKLLSELEEISGRDGGNSGAGASISKDNMRIR